MRAILMVFGAASLVAMALATLLVILGAIGGAEMDRTSKAYADASITAIASNWSADELSSRVATAYRFRFHEVQVEQFFQRVSRLGGLKQYDGAKGQTNFTFNRHGAQISAFYVAKADFQSGTATFQVMLVRDHGQWKIASFHVDSPLLAH